MWRKSYQEKLKEMNKENENQNIPVYYDTYSDEDDSANTLEFSDPSEEEKYNYIYGDQPSLRKRKREDDDDGYVTKKRKLNFQVDEDLADEFDEIVLDDEPQEPKKSKVMEWIENNMPVVQENATITMMREHGFLEQDEKVTGHWVNPNPPSIDAHLDIIMRPTTTKREELSEDADKEPSTEEDETIFLKKIKLDKASSNIPKSEEKPKKSFLENEDIKMDDVADSHVLTKDRNRRIVIKKPPSTI